MREVTTPQEIIDIIFQAKVDDKAEGTITPEKIRQIVEQSSMAAYEGEELFYPFASDVIKKLEEVNVVYLGDRQEIASESDKQELLRVAKEARKIITKALMAKENIVYTQVPEASPIESLRYQRWMKTEGKPGIGAKLSQIKGLRKSGKITICDSLHTHPEAVVPITKTNGSSGAVSFIKTIENPQGESDVVPKERPPTFNFQDHLKIILATMEGCRSIHGLGYAHNDIKPTNITVDASCADFRPQFFDHETVDKDGFDIGEPFGAPMYTDFRYYKYLKEEAQKSSKARDIFALGIWLILAYMDAIEVNAEHKAEVAIKVYEALRRNIIQQLRRAEEIKIDNLIKILGGLIDGIHEGLGSSMPIELKQLIAEMIQGDREKRPTIDEAIARLKSLKEGILAEHTPPAFAKKHKRPAAQKQFATQSNP